MNKEKLEKILVSTIKDNIVFFLKGPLSQWWPSRFTHLGREYVCCEQWMMLQKAVLFKDMDIAEKIGNTTNARICKDLGRQVAGFDEKTWEENRYSIVKEGNILKFKQNPKLLEILKMTENLELVEANPRDHIWGIGFGAENVGPRSEWGLNLLGKILMEVRAELC